MSAKKAAIQRTTAEGQYRAAEEAASESQATPAVNRYKGKGPIPLSENRRQEAGPFPFVGCVTCEALRAVRVHSQYP